MELHFTKGLPFIAPSASSVLCFIIDQNKNKRDSPMGQRDMQQIECAFFIKRLTIHGCASQGRNSKKCAIESIRSIFQILPNSKENEQLPLEMKKCDILPIWQPVNDTQFYSKQQTCLVIWEKGVLNNLIQCKWRARRNWIVKYMNATRRTFASEASLKFRV